MFICKSENLIEPDENISVFKKENTGKVKEHIHDFFELVYVWQGDGYQIINNKSYHVKRGDLILFNIGDIHKVSSMGNIGVYTFLIKPEFISKELKNSHDAMDILTLASFNEFNNKEGFLPKVSFTGKDLICIESVIETMLKEFKLKALGYKTVLQGYLNILITMFLRNIYDNKNIEINQNISQITPIILSYIEKNFNHKISIEELSAKCFYNPSYMSKIFKECFGMTWTEYVNNIRLNKALDLLEKTDHPVDYISKKVGYKSKKQFYNLFKKYTKITPGQYREKTKENTL